MRLIIKSGGLLHLTGSNRSILYSCQYYIDIQNRFPVFYTKERDNSSDCLVMEPVHRLTSIYLEVGMKGMTKNAVWILTLVCLGLYCSMPTQAFADHRWAVGEWRLAQYFTQNDGAEVTFHGRIRINREDHRWYGDIYFDTLGRWEPLQDIEVTDDTIRFTRPMYEQRFYGHRNRYKLNGTYKDRIHQGRWEWSAEKE